MNSNVKSSFRPPGGSKKGFKPPTRISSSQETNTQQSLNSVSSKDTQSSDLTAPRRPLKEISNTNKELNDQQATKENSAFGPSIIWDSHGSQPIADAELPEWAKELPENSESFINRTNDAQSESNLIDTSIFDDVLRKTLCGEQTVNGGLLADIKTGVEVTHESPTIWSSQEISQRLSQSQKSAISTQSEKQETYSQVFESSQNPNTQKSDTCDKQRDDNSQSNAVPTIGSRPSSPDFDAFDCQSSDNEDAITSENPAFDNVRSNQRDVSTYNAVIAEEAVARIQSSPQKYEKMSKNEQNADVETINKNSNETDAIENSENIGNLVENEVFAKSSDKRLDEELSTCENENIVSNEAQKENTELSNYRRDEELSDCESEHYKAKEAYKEKERASPSRNDEIVEETPVKAYSSQGSKFEALMNHDSEDPDSEYDAIDEHVFSQVMNYCKFTATSNEDSSDDGIEEQNDLVQGRGDTPTSGKKTKESSSIINKKSGSFKRIESPSNMIMERHSLNEKEQRRTLYHKTLMKRHHESRMKNVQKRKEPIGTSKKSMVHHCSLKKRLLELQSSRTEAVWVECSLSNCQKWRYLSNVNDPAELPNNWTCSMNQDDRFNSCKSPEQGISDIGEKLENFVECSFTVGSIVWAKVPGDLWWPAMVDDDPDTEDFYWTDDLEDHFSVMLIPSWYHVVFFETSKEKKVERAWVRIEYLRKFKIGEAMPKNNKNLLAKQEQKLKVAVKTAEHSLRMDLFERRSKYCFAARYRGKWGQAIDWENIDDEEMES